MTKFFKLTLLFLFSFGVLMAQSPKKAFKALKKGDNEKAKELFDEIIAVNKSPMDAVAANFGLSKIFSDKNYADFNAEKANKYIKKAIDLHKTLDEKSIAELLESDISNNSLIMQKLFVESLLPAANTPVANPEAVAKAAMEDAIKNLPDANNIKDVAKKNEQLAYNKAVLKQSVEALNEFLQKYPNAPQVEEAIRIRNSLLFEKVRKANNVDELQKFIDEHPDAEQLNEAIMLRNQLAYITMLEKSKELQNMALEKGKIQIEKNKSERNSFIIGFCLLLLVVGVSFFAYFRTKRTNRQLAFANMEISQQKNIILTRSTEITDSINYAKKIQEAILRIGEKEKLLPDSFILFKPKDIVSGDFYWMNERNKKILIVAADCTGHGVPGSFMSLICTSLLNQVVMEKGIVRPNLVLDEVRRGIISSLNQRGNPGEQKDGMDAALCAYDREKNTLSYSGANNPMYLIRKKGKNLTYVDGTVIEGDLKDDDSVLFQIKPDKQPIGYHGGLEFPFTEHSIQLNDGDTIYLFSDGYADQFGGSAGKKFKYKQLKLLLLSIQKHSMQKQKDVLEQTIEEWRGSHEQIDDICIVGFKIKNSREN